MNKITQDMRFKQAVILYSYKKGVTAAAIRYKTSRQNIYRWRKKYDGNIHSLADGSHRPHSHPNQHTDAELKLIKDMRRRNPHAGLVVFWVKLRQRGYTRSISGLYKVLRRIDGKPIKLPNPKYIPKPYEQKLTTMDLQKFYRKLMTKGRVERIEATNQPKGLSAKTVQNINQVISSAMDFAVAQRIISVNPCRAVALPKVEHKEMQTIPTEQLQAFLTEAKASGVYEMYYIELATGLRRGELLGLK